MSWLGFGGKKRQTTEEAYKLKLNSLEKLGYADRGKNLQLLKLYRGDVNCVIQDYSIEEPPAEKPPKEEEPPVEEPPDYYEEPPVEEPPVEEPPDYYEEPPVEE
eukprot:285211_1